MKRTPFGKYVAKLRIDHDMELAHMARAMDVDSDIIRRTEVGDLAPGDRYVDKLVALFDLSNSSKDLLLRLALVCREDVTISFNDYDSMTKAMLIKLVAKLKTKQLTDYDINKVSEIVN